MCKAASLSLRNPRIYTNTTPAVVQGSRNQRQTTPRTPAGLVLVYILGARIHRTCRPRAWSFLPTCKQLTKPRSKPVPRDPNYRQVAAQKRSQGRVPPIPENLGPGRALPWVSAGLGMHGTWCSIDCRSFGFGSLLGYSQRTGGWDKQAVEVACDGVAPKSWGKSVDDLR